MSKLVLVRGLPGSGKSTFARELSAAGYVHLETDMWFIDADAGGYVFNPRYLSEAHKWCQEQAATYIYQMSNVVVSNTFTQLWEMEPYFKMGAHTVTIVECVGSYGNVHGVPADKVKAMADRWEKVTSEWLERMKDK
jgi:adenylate kinase family enzyme